MQLPKSIPQLDVLRGAAVLAVVFFHAADYFPSLHLRTVAGSGYLGVDLFFVLSGFLITGVLVRTKDAPGYFRNFYARRILRIWPLYYLLLLLTFAILPGAVPSFRGPIFRLCHPWQSYLVFAQNLFANAQGAFATVRVTWSLAVEEQFYLAWPVAVWLAPRRALKSIALGALAFSVAARWSGQAGGLIPPVNTFTNPMTRLDGLALGAFLAIWIPEKSERAVRWTGLTAIASGLPTAILLMSKPVGFSILDSLVAAVFAGLLCFAVTVPMAWSGARFMAYTGKISYCLYLAHVPVFMMLGSTQPGDFSIPVLPAAIRFGASLALCYLIGEASWRFYEGKFLRLKARFESTPGVQTKANLAAAHNDDLLPVQEIPS